MPQPIPFDLLTHNAAAWDQQTLFCSPWPQPVGSENPAYAAQGVMRPRFTAPYSDLEDLDAAALAGKQERGEALIFGHSLASQIGGRLATGFVLAGFLEEMQPKPRFEIEKFMPGFIATMDVKP